MNTNKIYNALQKAKRNKKSLVSALVKEGTTEAEAKKMKEAFNASETLKEFERRLKEVENFQHNLQDERDWETALKFTDNYVYNKADDKYVIYLKAANGNVVFPGEVIRGIIENYSNWLDNPRSINEICRNYKIPRSYFNELKSVLNITHDSLPVSKEELLEKDIDTISEDILEKKRFQLYQKLQKSSWEQTQEAANKWFFFQSGVIEPMKEFFSSWQPPKYTPIKYTGTKKSSKRSMLVGLSDLHFGAYANPKDSYTNKEQKTQDIVDYLDKFAKEISETVNERSVPFEECVVASLGDILHTTGQGFTNKGTLLRHDCLKEEQFNIAFNSLVKFLGNMLETFPKVRVAAVKGNHSPFGDYVLFKALQAYYRTEKRIAFDVCQSDHGMIRIQDTLVLITHGYSSEYKAKLPSEGKARESYIANLFLSKPELLVGAVSKVFLSADQHNFSCGEYAEFERYMLSTPVKGDAYAEALGLNSIPRQSCLVISDEGVKEIVHCFVR